MQLTIPLTVGLKGTRIAAAITGRKITNPLGIRYWSTVPYRLGLGGQAMKYSARPLDPPQTPKPSKPGPDFLREVMIAQLAEGDARFEFLVQRRTSDDQSIENPLQEWKEDAAPFTRVATITIPKQTFATEAQDAFGENLSFNPWHCVAEHKPLGGVNRIRRVVYEAISAFRHARNGTSRFEPTPDTTP